MRTAITIIVTVLLFACQPKTAPTVEQLMKADIEFSDASSKNGLSKAFIEFAHDDAVLLRKNSMPLVGKPALEKVFENASSEGAELTWEPLDGDIAESGELGYTYGVFTMKMDTVIQKGTYVSIWKKDVNGDWKYVLDTGNQGLGEHEL